MPETSLSLLDRLQQGPNDDAWQRMVGVYSPLIQAWLRRYTRSDQDVEDLAQEVLAVVVRKLPEFQHRVRVGSFRRWLRSITVNCLRDFWRTQRYRPRITGRHAFGEVLDQLEDSQSALSKLWDREHDEHVTRHLLEKIRPRFEERTWLAFQMVALQAIPVEEVARDLGMTPNAVFIAKSRVVHQLRQEGRGLLD
jgi:RNA polymerase sigma-70 factor (ECF subfamily)